MPRALIENLVDSLRNLTTGIEEMLRHFEYVEARDSARHNSVMHLVQRMLPHLNLEDDDDDDKRHGDQTRDLSDTMTTQRILWAFQGLGDAMHPEHHLDGAGRENVAMLISVLTERFETLLKEAEERWHSTPAQAQEDDHAD